MADLATRLRNVRRDWDPRLSILTEAADEIERLTAALAKSCREDRAEFLGGCAEIERLRRALRKLVVAARTSGGVAGRDDGLCLACDEAERVLTTGK